MKVKLYGLGGIFATLQSYITIDELLGSAKGSQTWVPDAATCEDGKWYLY